jgi:DNA-directed RNA polymerase specialized sigma24 family protein
MTPEDYGDAIAHRFRALLTPFDQDLLARFYLDAQEPEKICRELGISLEEFQSRKSRAKTILTKGLVVEHAAQRPCQETAGDR